jgi:hypothetical protein
MTTTTRLCAASSAVLLWCATALPAAQTPDTDACTLLTPAQVTAAVGFPVPAGTHVTPTFVKTCTWTGTTKSAVQTVTLTLQTAAEYDGNKQTATRMTAAGLVMKPAAVGDDAYFVVSGTQLILQVKKGSVAFKIALYKQMPMDQKETMELALAKSVVAKL